MRKVLFICFLWISGVQVFCQKDLDSLQAALSQREGKARLEILQKLSFRYIGNDNLKAEKYAQEYSSVSQQTKDSFLIAKSYNVLGWVEVGKASYFKGLEHFRQSLEINTTLAKKPEMAENLKNIGNCYYYLSDYDEAMHFYLQSLKISDELNDDTGRSKVVNNIGNVYVETKDFVKALEYFTISMQVDERLGDKEGMIISLNNIANAYKSMKNYPKALEYYQKYLDRCDAIGTKKGFSLVLSRMGMIYLELKNPQQAIKYYEQALAYEQKLGSLAGIADCQLRLGKAYIALQKYDIASEYTLKGLENAKKMKVILREMEAYENLTDIYEAQQDYTNAFMYQKKATALKDSIFSKEGAERIAKMQSNYENEKKQKEIQVLKREKDVLEEKNKVQNIAQDKRKAVTTGAFVAIGLLATLAVMLYITNRNRRKINQKLVEQQNEITEKNKALENSWGIIELQNHKLRDANAALEIKVQERTAELQQTNHQLRSLNQELDTFLYKASHDLKGPIARLIGLCNIALMEITDENALDYLKRLSLNAKNMSNILENLLLISDIRNIRPKPVSIDFEIFVNRIFKSLQDINQNFVLEVRNESQFVFQPDSILLDIALRNLLQNAINYQNPKQPLVITAALFKKTAETVCIQIKDNGLGIENAMAEKLFTIFSKGESSKGTGLGLYMSKLAIERMNGQIELVSYEAGNTIFEITMPIMLDTAEMTSPSSFEAKRQIL